MTARPAHSGTATDRVPGHGAAPDAITADPDLALAGWENEGGVTARLPHPEGDAHSAAVTDRGNRFSGSTTTDATADDRRQEPDMHQPHRVRIGRVHDERTAADGTRVLVDRLWPRGLTKDRADLDEWCKQIAPSPALRTWYGHDPDRFAEFGRRYRTELDDPERAATLAHLRELAQQRTLTLFSATRHPETSQAAVLTDLLNNEPGTR